MKVLVTGANGQLGTDLVKLLSSQWDVYGLGRNDLDITDYGQVRQVIHDIKPDVIIHTAAYTAVDLAETEVDQAYLVNAYGTRNAAVCSEEIGAKICYISTDYVFDGDSEKPYKEYDETNPKTVYGKTKLAGERLVQTLSNRYFIVRTSWVYGLNGNNFVKTMIRMSQEKKRIEVVNDQFGSPTYTADLSAFLSNLVATEYYGIYHASNSGSCSWYEFAKMIFELIDSNIKVDPCSTNEFPRPAARPHYSVLDQMSIRCNGFQELRHWQEALIEFINNIKGDCRETNSS